MEPDFLKYQQNPEEQSLKSHLIELFQTLVVCLAIGTVIYWLIAQPHKVSGSSMFPNFKDGDLIITDKVTYKFNEPQRGDIVVFKSPQDQNTDFIKRIIGLPGDNVKIQNYHVYLNDKLLTEPYLQPTVITEPKPPFTEEGKDITVPPGKYLVFGDNRQHSSDSREWGYITKDEIIGRVLLRYWPQDEIGIFPAAYLIKPS